MASVYWNASRKSWRLAVVVNGRRRTLWLGNITQAGAMAICRHIELLLAATQCAVEPPDATRTWVNSVDQRIAKKLREWGLIQHAGRPDLPSTLRAWIDYYIKQSDNSERTKQRYRNTRDHICDRIPGDTPLRDITEAQADRMAADIRMNAAASTAGKTIKNAKMFLSAAVKARVITSSPFAHLKGGGTSGKDRDYYVEPEAMDLIIEHTKDPLWKCIYALTRYAGLRCPSEILCLRWADINFETGIIALDSPKTGLRHVPIFAKVRPYLEAEAVTPRHGNPYVCWRYRSANASGFARHLEASCRAAGIAPWPKPWVNMRASARTDMEEQFPVATCNLWMGHSTKVAREHYARVSNVDWQKAIGPPPEQKPQIRLHKDA